MRSVSILEDLIAPTQRHGVSPERITVEITESVLLSNDAHTTRMLQTLKDCGFALALDDFGTGYSSLAYIRDFPFDRLKIDRSFVHGLQNSDRALAIIEAVANFGRILGKDVVAEGIETEQEMQAMQKVGCTHLQGWLFSKALPAERIEAMVALGRLSAIRSDRAVGVVGEAGAESPVAARAITSRRRGRAAGLSRGALGALEAAELYKVNTTQGCSSLDQVASAAANGTTGTTGTNVTWNCGGCPSPDAPARAR